MIEQTLVIIKPDGVQKNLIGKIISYYEEAGLVVKDLKMRAVDQDLITKHYPEDEDYLRSIGDKAASRGVEVPDSVEYGRMIVNQLKTYLTEGPVVQMILEGEDAVAQVRKITGSTEPISADKGTIRGDLGDDSFKQANLENRATKNLVHASATVDEAQSEIALWFDGV